MAQTRIPGVPRIHGELLKLGIEVSQTTVAKYAAGRRPPSQGWKTFLKNHSREIVSVGLFRVPTITYQIPYVFLMVENSTRRIVHFNVAAQPTMEWTARQLVEAFPWDTAPTCILRDRYSIHGRVFTATVAGHGNRGSARGSSIALAESIYGEADRDCAAGLPGSCDRSDQEGAGRRGPPSSVFPRGCLNGQSTLMSSDTPVS